MANTQYALHLKGFVGGADFDRNYVDYVLAQHVGLSRQRFARKEPCQRAYRLTRRLVATILSIASAATIGSLGAKHISIDAKRLD